MDNYYERLNQAFANWNGGGEPSLEQRVENLESEILQKQDILTFDTEPVEDSKNPVTSGGLFSNFERYATNAALDKKVDTSNFTADQDRQDALEAEDRAALRELWQKINAIKRTYKVPISSTPVNGIYFGVQMFPFEFESAPEGTAEVQNTGQGGVSMDPTKFTVQIKNWGFRIYTKESTYAGLIADVKIS